MDKYVQIKDCFFKLSVLHHLQDGRYVISFWVNEGTANQDLLTVTVDDLIQVSNQNKEIYKVVNKLKPDF